MNKRQTNEPVFILAPLIKSINQIATFYATLPNPEAAKQQMLKHLVATWVPSMFTPLVDYLGQEADGGELSPLAVEVVRLYHESYLAS